MQRIRAAHCTSGGRFFYEGQCIDGRDGAVDRAASVGRDELEADGAEEAAEHLSRSSGPLLEHVLDVVQPVLDPLEKRRAEDILAAATQRIGVLGELVDAALGLD